MNIRQFSMALLISALPQLALAEAANISLNQGDFIAAEKITRDGKTLVKVKLSKSGKAKFKKLNEHAVKQNVHSDIAGVSADFTLREPIAGDGLEMGPYSADDADKVTQAVNK